MVLLSVSLVSERSHDLVDIHSHLQFSTQWQVEGYTSRYQPLIKRSLVPHNFSNAGNVLREVKARILVLHVSSR